MSMVRADISPKEPTTMSNEETRVIGRHAIRILELLDDIRTELRTDNVSFEIRVIPNSAETHQPPGSALHTPRHTRN
jgi:hypothetical protein